jgi:hypothetical protein
MLAPIGFVTIPPDVLLKFRTGHALSELEETMLAFLPDTAARLLPHIPRLEGVARIVRYQNKRFDGSGFPADAVAGDSIPLGSRLLKILLDLSDLQAKGLPRAKALDQMRQREGWYDPALLAAVPAGDDAVPFKKLNASLLSVALPVKDLAAGMILRSSVETRDGLLILSAGHRLTDIALEKVRNFNRVAGIKEPILVETTEPVS